MQTVKWGKSVWCFNHSLPFLFPEILSDEQVSTVISYLENLKNILPCKYCRMSYTEFLKELPPKNFILNPPPFLKFPKKSRLAVAKWLEVIHDKVNEKLSKPKPSDFRKTCCILEDDCYINFCKSMWDFIFVVTWNYVDEDWRREGFLTFIENLEKILEPTTYGYIFRMAIQKHPLHEKYFLNPEKLKHWAYNIRKNMNIICGTVESFQKIDEKYESWRSQTCSEKSLVKKNQ